MRTPRRAAVGMSTCLLLSSLLLAPPVVAATLIVDDDSACPGAMFTTIQAAINAASAGDTIQVCAGTYSELISPGPVEINKSLTLEGAQAGIDARARVASESVITDPQGVHVNADNVVLNGFTIRDSVAGFPGFGIWINNTGVEGSQILNNIITANIAGIGLSNEIATQALIRHNLFLDNNVPGSATGSGIYTDEFVGPSTRNILIEENAFVGNDNAGIDISNTGFFTGAGDGGVFDLEVQSNTFQENGRALVLFGTRDSTFDGNIIRNSTLANSADFRLFDNNSNLLFTNNDLRDGVGHAVRLSPALGAPNSDVEFHFNNFVNYPLTGMTVEPGSHVGTVDAECNWWNSATGPLDIDGGNPGGVGEEARGDIDYSPWLLAPAPGGACRGGIPSTPGKVTGGGQLPGTEPAFSPAGNLLSAPAVVPSAASPAAQATFGFVVTCCRAKGNLEYNDHQADVRIKVRSIDGLTIGDGTCGSRTHATFFGTAMVYRSSGTSTESFAVEVDDCGEPGTLDTFSIETDSYTNGPNVLIGGNIQIHR